jgi:hypothetical protein
MHREFEVMEHALCSRVSERERERVNVRELEI